MSKEVLRDFQQRQELLNQNLVQAEPKKLEKIIDKLIYPAGLLGPIFALPQLFEVWIHKSAKELSLTTWLSWLILSFIWLAYGLIHKNRPIIVSNILWIIIEAGITMAIIIYK